MGEWKEEARGKRNDIHDVTEALRGGKKLVDIVRASEGAQAAYVRYNRGFEKLSAILRAAEPPIEDTSRDVECVLYFGKTHTGKSREARTRAGAGRSPYWVSPTGAGFWFDGYVDQPGVIIDDFAGAASHWTLVDLLRVTDIYPVSLPVKGGFVLDATPIRIYFTTNVHPIKWFDYTGRIGQYAALRRRFKEVRWWRTRDGLTVLKRDEGGPLWDLFWRGPRLLAPRVVLGRDELYREVQEVDEFDWD